MTITALPSPPLPTDTPSEFNTKAFAWVVALGTFTTEANAFGTTVLGYSTTASNAAATATTKAAEASASAANAAGTAGVTQWVSGTTYTAGNCVWSPSNRQTYRRNTNGAGTTDPSADPTNWTCISANLAAGYAMGNTPLSGIKTATFAAQVAIGATTGSIALDWSAGQCQRQPEPTGNITYTFSAPPGPCHLQLLIDSDGTSSARAFTWPASVKWLSVQWAHIANKRAIINFWYDGSNYFATGANEV